MRERFGEWTPDLPPLSAAVRDALNCVSYANHYGPLQAVNALTSALPSAPVAGFSTSNINGTVETYAATAINLYQLVANAWTDRSGGVYVVDVPEWWSFAQYRNRVYAASYNNLLQQREIGTANNFASITDSPMGRAIGVVGNFLLVGDINDPTDGDVPERVRWSPIDNPSATWPLPGLSSAIAVQSDEVDLRAESGAVMAIHGSEIGIILQETAVVRAEYVGAPKFIDFKEIDSSKGLLVRGASVQVGRTVYFLSEDGFYKTDGSGESTPIGYGKVDRWFFENLNAAVKSQVRAMFDSIRKVVIWTFPSLSSSTNDMMLLYNPVDERWTRANIATTFAVFSRTSGYTLEDLDTLGTLETIPTTFDSSFYIGGASQPAVFTTDYKLGSLSGDPLSATIEIGELSSEDHKAGGQLWISGVRPLVEGGAATIAIGTRKLPRDSIVWGAQRSITEATGSVDFRSSAKFQSIRMVIPSGFTKAIGVDIEGPNLDGRR